MLIHRFRMLILVLSLSALARASTQDKTERPSISGTVMFSVTREPVAGAQVELAKVDPGPSLLVREVLSDKVMATTDSTGRFSFNGLKTGEYQLIARLPESPGGPTVGQPRTKRVMVTAGVQNQNTELWLTLMSKVSGRVVNAEGQPALGYRVQLGRIVWNGGPTLTGVDGSNTSIVAEDGQYTVLAPPGDHYLLTVLQPSASAATFSVIYTYYPGVAFPEDAIRFSVRAGSDLGGLNISLRKADQFRVRFRFPLPSLPGVPEPLSAYLSGDAKPLEAFLRPAGARSVKTNASSFPVQLEYLGEDTWLTPPLDPGDYELALQYSNALSNGLRAKQVTGLDWNQLSPLATFQITVDPKEDRDKDLILDVGTIPLSTKVSIPGRLVLQGASNSNLDFTRLRFWFVGTSFGMHVVNPAADGTFEIKGVHPSLYRLGPDPADWDLPDGYYVASVTGNGDVLKDGLRIVGGMMNSIELVIADNAGRIEGAVRDQTDRRVPDARVILIPSANQRGTFSSFPSTLANGTGAFTLDRIPPSDYRLLALDLAGIPDIGPFNTTMRNWEGPDFLARFGNRGASVRVSQGARLVVDPVAIPFHE